MPNRSCLDLGSLYNFCVKIFNILNILNLFNLPVQRIVLNILYK